MAIPMDELCELAHEETRQQCERENMVMDTVDEDTGSIIYTEFAQKVFNEAFDLIESDNQ